jgi:hypothetical protein
VEQALAQHGLVGPPPREADAADPVPRPAPYDLGLDIAPPPPEVATALGPAAPRVPEPPSAHDDTAAEAEEIPGAPIVLGVHCKNGHFTDPDARSCVVCGAGISRRSAAPQRGPRPALGVLILDDGAAVDVDGDYVIGRDPGREPSVSAGEARPLRVVDAESTVSRVHARVHLDGWQVLLTDLGSANGTRIQQPGAKAEQLLDPRVPVPLQPGARIFVGAPCLRFERPGG